jgi:hypothetical protein
VQSIIALRSNLPKSIATASGVSSSQYAGGDVFFFHFYNSATAQMRRSIFLPDTSIEADYSKDRLFRVLLKRFQLAVTSPQDFQNPVVSAHWENIPTYLGRGTMSKHHFSGSVNKHQFYLKRCSSQQEN